MSTISKLMLGTVQFGLNYGIANQEGKPDMEKVKAILHKAADAGITVLDTAAGYGDSEVVLGTLLTEDKALRSRFKVVTKVVHFPDDVSQDEGERLILNSVTQSLQRLKTERLFGILFHREQNARFLPYLKTLKEKGLVEFAGFSADGVLPDETGQADMIQVPGNVLDRRFVPFPKQKTQYLFVRSVYLQGLLMMPEERIPQSLQAVIPCRRKLEELAHGLGIAPGELYMRYLLSIPEIDAVLTGVDNADQLDFNVKLAAKGPLNQDVMARIRAIVPDYPEEIIRPSKWEK